MTTRLIAMLMCLTLLASVIVAGQADAADEDTQASVYLVFDPETGEFVTVDDPSVTAQHAAVQTQEEIDSGLAAGPGSATDGQQDSSGEPPMVLAIGAAVAVLVLGGFFWLRRGRQNTA